MPSVPLGRRPTSGGAAYRGMGGIVNNNANNALTTGWQRGRGGGATGMLPDGCGLRVGCLGSSSSAILVWCTAIVLDTV